MSGADGCWGGCGFVLGPVISLRQRVRAGCSGLLLAHSFCRPFADLLRRVPLRAVFPAGAARTALVRAMLMPYRSAARSGRIGPCRQVVRGAPAGVRRRCAGSAVAGRRPQPVVRRGLADPLRCVLPCVSVCRCCGACCAAGLVWQGALRSGAASVRNECRATKKSGSKEPLRIDEGACAYSNTNFACTLYCSLMVLKSSDSSSSPLPASAVSIAFMLRITTALL